MQTINKGRIGVVHVMKEHIEVEFTERWIS